MRASFLPFNPTGRGRRRVGSMGGPETTDSSAEPRIARGRRHAAPLRASWHKQTQNSVPLYVPRLGELLVERGVLSAEQLEQALARQRVSGRRLGVELVRGGYVAPRYVRHALWLQRWIALSAFATVVAVAATDSRDAEATARAELGVSAFVLPVAVLQVEHQVPELLLTAADIARGYVNVPAASRLAIRTSSRAGYMLDFHPRLALFTSVEVTSASGHSELGPEGGTLISRGPVGHGVATSLSYRFELDRNVKPGTYPWPLAVSVRPL